MACCYIRAFWVSLLWELFQIFTGIKEFTIQFIKIQTLLNSMHKFFSYKVIFIKTPHVYRLLFILHKSKSSFSLYVYEFWRYGGLCYLFFNNYICYIYTHICTYILCCIIKLVLCFVEKSCGWKEFVSVFIMSFVNWLVGWAFGASAKTPLGKHVTRTTEAEMEH